MESFQESLQSAGDLIPNSLSEQPCPFGVSVYISPSLARELQAFWKEHTEQLQSSLPLATCETDTGLGYHNSASTAAS